MFSSALVMSAGPLRREPAGRLARTGRHSTLASLGRLLSVLGVAPVIGRALNEQDANPSNTAVIGYRLWRERFHEDPGVVGTAVVVGTKPYTIVGVAPAGFTGVMAGQPIDIWLPITWFDRQSFENPVAFMFRMIARRKPGISKGPHKPMYNCLHANGAPI